MTSSPHVFADITSGAVPDRNHSSIGSLLVPDAGRRPVNGSISTRSRPSAGGVNRLIGQSAVTSLKKPCHTYVLTSIEKTCPTGVLSLLPFHTPPVNAQGTTPRAYG